MRPIDKHIIHCSATPNGKDVKSETIEKWHTDPKPQGNGWNDIGYHFVIEQDGTIKHGRPVQIKGAHCYGQNSNSIGTCLVGNDKFTIAQIESLNKLDKLIKHIYNEDITTHGHNEFTEHKTCPNFDVQEFLKFSNIID